MKIAILADIHGNQFALKAVLKRAKVIGIDHLFILGDCVGYYYNPDKVIQYLNEWSYDMILGNHEVLLKKAYYDKNEIPEIIKKYGHGIDISLKVLNEKVIKQLIELEERKTIVLDNVKFELSHGSPWDINLYIYPDSDIELHKKCASYDADFVLMGHTHHPFVFEDNNTIVANVGSVGQNRSKGGIASWAIVNTENRTLVQKETKYDITNLLGEVEKHDKDTPYLKEVLLR